MRFLPTFRAPIQELAHFFSGRGGVALTRNELFSGGAKSENIKRNGNFQNWGLAVSQDWSLDAKTTQPKSLEHSASERQPSYHARMGESNNLIGLLSRT
jgi:hypothetical protein